MMTNWHSETYLSLATLKKNGDFVETPVWFALENEKFYMFSEGKAWKVKRIKNFPQSKVSPCTVTGKIKGPALTGSSRILPSSEADIAYKALLKKYGWQLKLLNIGARLAGKIDKRAFIEFIPDAGQA